MRLRSRCANAAQAENTIVTTASPSNGVRSHWICSGKIGSRMRRKPYTPIFDITPVSSIVTGDRRFGIRRRQPGVERHQRHFHREAQQHAAEDHHGQLPAREIKPAELADERRIQFAARRQLAQLDEIKNACHPGLLVARKMARNASSIATLPTMV